MREFRVADVNGDGVDRLSGLPEDLLLQILAGLRSARTGVLSRRWRGLWTSLPDLSFNGVALGSVEAALAHVTHPALDRLHIRYVTEVLPSIDGEVVSSLLRAAARLAPKNLALRLSETKEEDVAIDLPCLDRTVSLAISMLFTPLALPQSGECCFAALRSLSLKRCLVDVAALLPMCPQLRNLVLCRCLEYKTGAVIHAPLLEELVLEEVGMVRVDVVAPELRKVTATVEPLMDDDDAVSVSFSAPKVDQSEWGIVFQDTWVGFGQLWLLDTLCQTFDGEKRPCAEIQLSTLLPDALDPDLDFAQAIALVPVANFSVLDLTIVADSHAFGPVVLHLLRMQPLVIRKFKLLLEEPSNWRSESVPLTNLEMIQIVGLKGREHEVDFLKLMFRCATGLKKMTLRLSDGASTNESAYEKIHSLFKEYTNVECFAYNSCVSIL
ncbi:hypothetical protein EJB05_12663, partial [Eragrostis curvula]